jgi:hypothetical protein
LRQWLRGILRVAGRNRTFVVRSDEGLAPVRAWTRLRRPVGPDQNRRDRKMVNLKTVARVYEAMLVEHLAGHRQ